MATETLRPNASGDECSITFTDGCSDCPNHYDCVDEATPDDDTTRLTTSNSTYQRDLYNLPASSGSGTINKITIWVRIIRWISSDQNWCKICLKTGGTAYESAELDTSGEDSYENHSSEWATNPDTGSAWTWDEIDALQIGIALRSCRSYEARFVGCTQVYVEVDYTPVTEKTSSDAGSGADAFVSLQIPQLKTSSDAGSGVEAMPVYSAVLAGVEIGSGIEAFIARLLATAETGYGAEASEIGGGGLLKHLFASELGEGADGLTAKIEIPNKGGGMRLWT